ncbi:chromosome segregation protein SMC [Fructilactobacillus cliffordii]|uniref:Chromosome partition protein Smc n=1 Tax=Fructilactobacillus cliffordii TaxID=2940299 RepID=A0A9Q8ZU71_9LACO|nr:chromosome segregation protein SMC [Fructilactobacillus cliffordii]USS89684.1 chromosome segregation protein SMC [Fructilactobacillus cliffordii]
MKLQSIQISGFKSFAERTVIDCQDGLTGIVGPNGSGKSNIIEAIRWALGEQSAKQLRGQKMKDVIFSGSNDRRPLNRAEVSLQFENHDHYLATDYSEVKITRRYYRNGESNYLINDQECLLRDIQRLFLDTGLGEGSLSIISQGNVDDILAGSGEQRRAVIETAAGVYQYKKQKADSEKKLADTQANVERVSDIARELNKQLEPLKAQCATAKEYLEHTARLEQLRYTQLVTQRQQFQQQQQHTTVQLQDQEVDQQRLTKQLEQLNEQKQTVHQRLTTAEQRQDELQQQLLAATKQLESVTGKAKLRKQQLEFKQTRLTELQERHQQEQEKINQLKEQLQAVQMTEQTTIERLQALTKQIEASDATKKLKQVDAEEAELEQAQSQYVALMQKLTNQKNELRMADQLSERQQQAYQEKQRQLRELETEKLRQEATLATATQNVENLQQQVTQAQAQQQRFQAQVDELANQQEQQQQSWYQQLRDLQTVKTECDSLQNMVTGHNNLYRGSRNLLQHRDELTGILGPVGDFLQVEERYLQAIETTLGGAIQQIVVDNVKNARQAIRFLSQRQLGRVTLLPLDAINERFVNPSLLRMAEQQPGFLGVAADLVTMPAKMKRVKVHLLGNVIIADDLKHATAISQLVQRRVKIVTLAGEVVNAGGSITGGRNQRDESGILRQRQRLDQLTQRKTQLKQQLKQQEQRLAEIKQAGQTAQNKRDKWYQQESTQTAELKMQQQQVAQLTEQLERQKREQAATRLQLKLNFADDKQTPVDSQDIAQTKADLDQNQATVKRLKQAIQTHKQQHQQSQSVLMKQQQRESQIRERLKQERNQVHQVTKQLQTAQADETQLQQQLTQLRQDLAELESDATINPAELQSQIEKQQQELQEIKQQITTGRTKAETLESEITDQHQALTKVQQQAHDLQVDAKIQQQHLTEVQSELQSLQDSSNQELQVLDLDEATLQQELDQVQDQITALGPVNVGAISAYDELKTRADFVNEQLDDLLTAKTQLLTIMNQMDQTVKERFQTTFNEVASAFTEVFRHIFGGGEAKLKLADPHHLLTTGIDILVKPPGKRYRDLSLLSGGEKALTALALLFAVLQVKPVPFVILDEAESALDPANVDRFARYMQKLKQQTQFIVITHRKETMVYADQLVGITMQDSGVSKLVSVNLEDTQQRRHNDGII